MNKKAIILTGMASIGALLYMFIKNRKVNNKTKSRNDNDYVVYFNEEEDKNLFI